MENESLDLREPGGQRWKYFLSAVRERKPVEDVVRQSEFRKLKGGDDTPAFVLNHLHGTGVIQEGESSEGVVELLKRYSDEWDCVIAEARRSGIAWTRLVGSEPNSIQGVRDVPA